MRIIIAPDSYKGSLSALDVASAMKRGILRVFPTAQIDTLPIADGGEGTVEALVSAMDGVIHETPVSGPLGEPLNARWGMLGDKETAVIEMAAASGLPLLKADRHDPLHACTFGTGQLIRAALDAGAKHIIIGIGGSATNDGGAGAFRALGVRFLDAQGRELPPGGAALANLAAIDITGMDTRLAVTDIRIACDVDNPLCGQHGASAVYGPQKGATPEMAQTLDTALAHYASIAAAATGKPQVAQTPGAGAAGGLGAGFLYFTDAVLRPGVELVLEGARFAERVRETDLVFTGEGRTDFQTAFGKAPVGVAAAAKKYGKPVICLSGGLGENANEVLLHGIDAIASIAPGPIALAECIRNGETLLADAAERVCRLLAVGSTLTCS